MRQFIIAGVVAVIVSVACGSEAQAVEVTAGDGIVVVDLTRAESQQILEAGDSAAAFARLVSPALPGEYRAVVTLAAGGWRMLRVVVAEPVPVRVVLTAIPPAVLVLPVNDTPAEEVIATYLRIRERTTGQFRSVFDRLDAARRDLIGYVSNTQLISSLRDTRQPADRFTVVAHGDGTVSFRNAAGYLSEEGGGVVLCPRGWSGDGAKWVVVRHPNGTAGLRSVTGHWLRTDQAGRLTLTALPGRGSRFALDYADGYVALRGR